MYSDCEILTADRDKVSIKPIAKLWQVMQKYLE